MPRQTDTDIALASPPPRVARGTPPPAVSFDDLRTVVVNDDAGWIMEDHDDAKPRSAPSPRTAPPRPPPGSVLPPRARRPAMQPIAAAAPRTVPPRPPPGSHEPVVVAALPQQRHSVAVPMPERPVVHLPTDPPRPQNVHWAQRPQQRAVQSFGAPLPREPVAQPPQLVARQRVAPTDAPSRQTLIEAAVIDFAPRRPRPRTTLPPLDLRRF